jgi:ribosomal-protein-alanine N-acetyltransferase
MSPAGAAGPAGAHRRRPAAPAAPAAPGAVRVTIAGPGDLDAIIALEHRCFSVHDRFARATWRRLLGRSARAGTSITLVVREGAAVVGTINALLRSTSAAARIYSLAVDPATQGRGLARRLFHALMQRLPRRIDAVTLEVREANAAARALYHRLGMAPARQLPGHYPDGGHGVRYRAARSVVLEAARARS